MRKEKEARSLLSIILCGERGIPGDRDPWRERESGDNERKRWRKTTTTTTSMSLLLH